MERESELDPCGHNETGAMRHHSQGVAKVFANTRVTRTAHAGLDPGVTVRSLSSG